MECSAKDNDNVDETFDAIIDRILKTKNFDTEIDTTIRADLEIEEKIIKKNCCTIL